MHAGFACYCILDVTGIEQNKVTFLSYVTEMMKLEETVECWHAKKKLKTVRIKIVTSV